MSLRYPVVVCIAGVALACSAQPRVEPAPNDLATGGTAAAGSGAGAAAATAGAAGTAGAPGTAGAAGAAASAPPTCEQQCRDYLVSIALLNTLLALYAEYIEGSPAGPFNVVAECPLAGSALITGAVEITDAGFAALDLRYSLRGCESSDAMHHLTFDGRVSLQGSVGAAGVTALTVASDALAMGGSLVFRDNPSIDETASLSATHQVTAEGATLTGDIGGRAFSSETAFTPPASASE